MALSCKKYSSERLTYEHMPFIGVFQFAFRSLSASPLLTQILIEGAAVWYECNFCHRFGGMVSEHRPEIHQVAVDLVQDFYRTGCLSEKNPCGSAEWFNIAVMLGEV
jgi:hypothetical protein